MVSRDAYELEPGTEFDYDEWEEDERMKCGKDYCEILENPYEDYRTYDLTVVETAEKIIHVFAKDEESAEEYLAGHLSEIDMERGIDKYGLDITLVAESGQSGCDYTVPLEWYE